MKTYKYNLSFFFFLLTSIAHSATIKVPQQFATIQEAISNSQLGDSVLVSDGIYYEEINFNGVDSIIVKSDNGPENCIIDCQNANFSIAFVSSGIDSRSIVEGFTIRNASMGIWVYGNSNLTIKNNIIKDCSVGINSGSMATPIINSNKIMNCINNGTMGTTGGGIHLTWSGATIVNNIIIQNKGSKGSGIYMENSSPTVSNNTIVENTKLDATDQSSSIYIKNSSPQIINNIIAFNNGMGIISSGSSSSPVISYNDFYNNSDGNYFSGDNEETLNQENITGTDGNISLNPLFFESGYLLTWGSPCVDTGSPETPATLVGTTDFYGNTRFYDGDGDDLAHIDMGAVELEVGESDNMEKISICAGESYEGHSKSGVFQRTVTSSTGADSVITTYLTVNPVYAIDEDVSICEGEEYFGHTQTGVYVRPFKTTSNCDSIVTTNLTVRPIGECYLTLNVPSEYATIQAAIDAANPGDTVIIADGTYTGQGNLFLTFNGKAIVVKSENGPENCIIDCVDGDGIQAFLFSNGETRQSVVDGLKIINGCWVIKINNSSPTIRNNILESNNRGVHCEGKASNPLIENNMISKSNDEGIYFENSTGIIRNNTIKRAMFSANFGDYSMSGIHCNMASPTITDNEIEWGFYGINNWNGSHPIIENNTIKNSYSSGISCNNSSPQITKNQITDNDGTGIYCENSSPSIRGNFISNNGGSSFASQGRGTYDNHQRPDEKFVGKTSTGGISINDHSNPNVQSNVITENKGVKTGAIYSDNTSSPIIANNHIINNSTLEGGSLIIENSSTVLANNIVCGAKSSDTYLGLSRWYKNDLFAKYIYDGAILENVTYYFGFINYGEPGEVQITGCSGLNKTVWAETGERFWVEAPSGVFSGNGGGLYVNVSMATNSFTINVKREYNFVQHGCVAILSPEITSYGTNTPGVSDIGIIAENAAGLPEITHNNVWNNPGGNYWYSESNEAKTNEQFNLTGTDGNVSFDPKIDSSTWELQESSPCIDAGCNDVTPLQLDAFDYFGNTRITDGNGDGNVNVDIGAHEMKSATIQVVENVSICQNETYEGHNESTTFQRTLTSTTGLDSIVTTHLTVNPVYAIENDVSICEGESFKEWNTTGVYQEKLKTQFNCDSIITYNLTVHEKPTPDFKADADTLTSTHSHSSYQWFDQNGVINGATSRKYVINNSGTYYLQVSNEHNCSATSEGMEVFKTKVEMHEKNTPDISILPNPNRGLFILRIDNGMPGKYYLTIFNDQGELLLSEPIFIEYNRMEKKIDGSKFKKGSYILKLSNTEIEMSKKIIIQ